jgi:hypothetical protein
VHFSKLDRTNWLRLSKRGERPGPAPTDGTRSGANFLTERREYEELEKNRSFGSEGPSLNVCWRRRRDFVAVEAAYTELVAQSSWRDVDRWAARRACLVYRSYRPDPKLFASFYPAESCSSDVVPLMMTFPRAALSFQITTGTVLE